MKGNFAWFGRVALTVIVAVAAIWPAADVGPTTWTRTLDPRRPRPRRRRADRARRLRPRDRRAGERQPAVRGGRRYCSPSTGPALNWRWTRPNRRWSRQVALAQAGGGVAATAVASAPDVASETRAGRLARSASPSRGRPGDRARAPARLNLDRTRSEPRPTAWSPTWSFDRATMPRPARARGAGRQRLAVRGRLLRGARAPRIRIGDPVQRHADGRAARARARREHRPRRRRPRSHPAPT